MRPGRKWMIILAVVVLVGVAVAGAAMATDAPKTDGNMGQVFLDKLAGVLGIDRAKLDEAMKNAGGQTLDQALQEGKITQQQADQMRSRIDKGISFFMGKGPGNMGEKRGAWAGGFMGCKTLADALGMTQQDLMSALREGKTVEELAAAKGTTVADIQNKILADTKAQLDKAVQDGKITQDQATKVYDKLQQSISSGDWMNKLQKGCQERGKGSQKQESPQPAQQ